MYQVLKILLSSIWFMLSGLVYYVEHKLEGENIVEIGYNSPLHPKKVIASKSTSKADCLIYWNLSRLARKNRKTVWVYFTFNIIILVYAVVSLFFFLLSFWLQSIRECLVLQCGWIILTIVFHSGITFVPDLLFLPSVQKRYGIKRKQKKQ